EAQAEALAAAAAAAKKRADEEARAKAEAERRRVVLLEQQAGEAAQKAAEAEAERKRLADAAPPHASRDVAQTNADAKRLNREATLQWVGSTAILGMLSVLVLFYLIRGMVRIEYGRSGRTLVRFNAFERFVHWMTASCFIVLALSGLNISFGK